MELRHYYVKLRTMEASIAEPYPVVKSKGTGDGGKAGIFTEVPRKIAAKMIVEGVAELASPEETKSFLNQKAEAARNAEQAAAAAKVQFAVVSADELKKLKSGFRAAKDQV